jgi:hypothetical protein
VLRWNDLIEKGKFRDRRCGKKSTVRAAINSGAVALRQSGEFTVSSRTLQRDLHAVGFKYGPCKGHRRLRKHGRSSKTLPADLMAEYTVHKGDTEIQNDGQMHHNPPG